MKVNADGVHYISLDSSRAELTNLGCRYDTERYIAIPESNQKESIISSVKAASRAGQSVIVRINPASEKCEVEELLLSVL